MVIDVDINSRWVELDDHDVDDSMITYDFYMDNM